MVKRKNDWELRRVHTASISLKKTISLPLESEMSFFVSQLNLGGYTQLNKEFILFKCKQTEKEFEKNLIDFILNKMNIKEREYSREFRRFLANKIKDLAKTKEQKTRWLKYINEKEWI